MGESLPSVGRNNGVLVLGVVIVAVAIWVIIVYGLRGDKSGSPIGVALISFGLMFAATITVGRTSYGLYVAGVSRYTTYGLLILVGCYLAILDRRTEPTKVSPQQETQSQVAWTGDGSPVVPQTLRTWKTNQRDDKLLLVLRVIVTSTIVILVILGTRNGLNGAKGWRQILSDSADVTVNVQKAPDGVVASVLYSFRDTAFTRQMAQIAKTQDLSVFATGAARQYAKEGLSVESRPVTRVVSPMNGTTLNGNAWLTATAGVNIGAFGFNASRVEFSATGGTLRDENIGSAESTDYGWLYVWNTTKVPNGQYTLHSIAYNFNGKGTLSAGVSVSVKNE